MDHRVGIAEALAEGLAEVDVADFAVGHRVHQPQAVDVDRHLARGLADAEAIEALAHVAEQAESLRLFHAAHPAAKDAPPADPQAEALASYCQVLMSSTLFLYVN